jgi:hypothetical protein
MKKFAIYNLLFIALLICFSGCSHTTGWECITTDLWKEIPDYEDGPNYFVRKSGSLLVHPTSGELFLLVSPKYGIWKSANQGKSWERVDGNAVSGRTWGGDGAKFDTTNFDRMVFFTIVGKGATPVSAISLDRGKTWKPFFRPRGMKHDGWTSGQVDWSDEPPKTIFAKQHHTENLWITHDSGENWKKVGPKSEGGSYKVGMIGDDVLLAAPKAEGNMVPILRSTDEGKTWTQVHEPIFLMQRSPHLYGDHAYWAISNSLLKTTDKGATWKPIGPIVKNVEGDEPIRTWGPMFGRSQDEMLVAVKGHGYYRTTDGGGNWTKIAEWMDSATEFDTPREAFSIGWDLKRKLVYCAFLGGETYRTEWIDQAKEE